LKAAITLGAVIGGGQGMIGDVSIFRSTLGAFVVICVSVTALIWITQALRDVDLMTKKSKAFSSSLELRN
jgi:lipopolysaccharide export LptBFGC system permease protein LptF